MLHMIDHASLRQGAVLKAMFEARKRVFVDLLGWDVPVIGGSFELDRFDDDAARYIVLTGASGGHVASARLLRTDRPHILGSLFPGLCDGPVPANPHTLEITRFCLDRGLRATERREARYRLVSALVDHALERGISRYTAVAERGWARQIGGFGWRCRALGAPQDHESGTLVALAIDIDAETPRQLAERGIYRSGDLADARAAA